MRKLAFREVKEGSGSWKDVASVGPYVRCGSEVGLEDSENDIFKAVGWKSCEHAESSVELYVECAGALGLKSSVDDILAAVGWKS